MIVKMGLMGNSQRKRLGEEIEFGKQKLNSDSGTSSHFFAKPNVVCSAFSLTTERHLK